MSKSCLLTTLIWIVIGLGLTACDSSSSQSELGDSNGLDAGGLADAGGPTDTRVLGPNMDDVVDGFRSPEELGVGYDGWRLIYVDPGAQPGGDGGFDNPVSSLANALEIAGAEPAVLILAAGTYRGPVSARASLAIIGAGTALTTIEASDDGPVLSATDLTEATIALGWLSIRGGQHGLVANGLADLYAINVDVHQSAVHAVRLSQVNTAAFLRCSFRGVPGDAVEHPLIKIDATGVAIFKSIIGQHGGPGFKAEFAETDELDCQQSPVCPFFKLRLS